MEATLLILIKLHESVISIDLSSDPDLDPG